MVSQGNGVVVGNNQQTASKQQQADGGQQQDIWTEILRESSSHAHHKERTANVVFVGDSQNGKRSLLALLQGKDFSDVQEGYALEYAYIDVTNPDENDADEFLGRVGIWYLEDPSFSDLLDLAINPDNVANTVIIITADLSKPHALIRSIETWINTLDQHLQKVFKQMPAEKVNELRDRVVNAKFESTLADAPKEEEVSGQGVVEKNLGVPLIIVGTKSDTLSKIQEYLDANTGPKRKAYDPVQFINFIQFHLRKLAYKHGAALIYTSALENKNIDTLLQYTVHRLFNARFGHHQHHQPDTKRRDAVFVPASWDAPSKINKLEIESIVSDPATPFNDVVVQTKRKKETDGGEVVSAEDLQSFLKRQDEYLKTQQAKPRLRPTTNLESPSAHVSHPASIARQRSENFLESVTSRKPAPIPSRLQAISATNSPSSSAASSAKVSPSPGSPNVGTPTSSTPIERKAEDFFKSMLDRYKK